MSEEWREVPGYEGRYEVSSIGRLKRIGRRLGGPSLPDGIRKPVYTRRYINYTLHKDGITEVYKAHQLVALAFLGPKPEGMEINHKDGDRLNNIPDNLEYVTHADNMRHSVRVLGKKPNPGKGGHHIAAKTTDAQTKEAKDMLVKGKTIQEVADHFGMSYSWAYAVHRGRRHIPTITF